MTCIFASTSVALQWAELCEDAPRVSDRIHGSFSFLALNRFGKVIRCTIGRGLIARSEEWASRMGVN